MADEVSAIGDQLAEKQVTAVSIESLVDDASRNQGIARDMSDAMNVAIHSLSSSPVEQSAPSDPISGAAQREVMDIQNDFISGSSDRPASGPVDGKANEISETANEMMSVVKDLTEWQITWGVAQTAQKDLTHILKSG